MNMDPNVLDLISHSFQNVVFKFADFVPGFIIAILLFVLGWVLGSLIGRGVRTFFEMIKLDSLLKSAGMEQVAEKAGLKFSASNFLGEIARWLIIITGLVAALSALQLDVINAILTGIAFTFLIRVAVSAIILIVAAYLSNFISKVVSATAKTVNAGTHSAMFATVAKYAVWIVAFVAVLDQMGIGGNLLQTLFQGVVIMLAIAGGLAFGLGGKDQAAKALDKISRDMSN